MLQRRDILRTTVAHTCTETTDELEDGILYTALVCDTTLDTLWYELLRVRLEVTIRRTVLLLHRTERSHATVYLVLTALVKLELTRCLVAACEYRTHHDGAATCSDRLHDITGVLDTTIGDDRDAVLVGYLERIHNRRYLWNTDTGNDTGRTDGARSDTDLYAVGAGLDEGLGRLTGRDITCDDLKIRELLQRVSNGGVREVIMATNPDTEGEATAMYLSRLLRPMEIRVTRLAYGVPVGSQLEYADEITLSRALEGRQEI